MKKIIVLFLLGLMACSPQNDAIPVGKEYLLTHPEPPMVITLKLDKDGRFYGKAVNNYFGVYEIKNTHITFNLQGQTMMAGPLPHMEFESEYFKFLRTIQKFKSNENQLILEGDRIYIFELNPN